MKEDMLPQHSNTTTIESINRTFMFIDLIDKHQPLDSESCNYFIHGGQHHGGAAGAGGQPRGQDPQPLPDPRAPGHPRHRHIGLTSLFSFYIFYLCIFKPLLQRIKRKADKKAACGHYHFEKGHHHQRLNESADSILARDNKLDKT